MFIVLGRWLLPFLMQMWRAEPEDDFDIGEENNNLPIVRNSENIISKQEIAFIQADAL